MCVSTFVCMYVNVFHLSVPKRHHFFKYFDSSVSCKKTTKDLGVRKDNIKMDFKQVGWKNIAWTDLVQD